MVISKSMQMEGGAQPASGAESPMPKIDPQCPVLPADRLASSLPLVSNGRVGQRQELFRSGSSPFRGSLEAVYASLRTSSLA